MNTDQAIKCTSISVTLRCQPYVWHMARSAMHSMENMREYSKPEERLCWPKLMKSHKHPPKGEQILILKQRNQSSSLQACLSHKHFLRQIYLFIDLSWHLLSLYSVSNTTLGTGDKGMNKIKEKITLMKLTFNKGHKQVSCHILTPKYCL